MIIETNSASETLALGEKLGKAAKPGQIYTLNGDLGVGKTVLNAGLCKRTWHHRGSQLVPHLPLFRNIRKDVLPFLSISMFTGSVDIEEMEEIGYDDYFFGEGVLPDRMGRTD